MPLLLNQGFYNPGSTFNLGNIKAVYVPGIYGAAGFFLHWDSGKNRNVKALGNLIYVAFTEYGNFFSAVCLPAIC